MFRATPIRAPWSEPGSSRGIGSMSAIAASNAAASATDRAMGPAVSCVCEIGTIPSRLTSPTVGLTPTMPFMLEGQMIEPSVSVPTAAVQRLADTATPDPELDPHGMRSRAYGL